MTGKSTVRTALVTGGAQGIGRAIAERLLSEGDNVVITDIDKEACWEAEAELGRPEGLFATVGDVSKEKDDEHAVAETIARFGRLDVLVCNAGVSGFFGVPVTELSLEQWQRGINVNLTGCFLFAKHAAPFLENTRGCIISA